MADFCDSKGDSVLRTITWNQAEVVDALNFLEQQQALFLTRLTELLNSFHGINKSPAYYELLCGNWLQHFTHALYAAYLDVIHGLTDIVEHSEISVFSDHTDYLRAIIEDPLFSKQLRWQVIRLLNRSNCDRIKFAQQIQLVRGPLSSTRRRFKSSVLDRVGKKSASFVLHRPSVKCSHAEWFQVLWKWREWAREESFEYPIEVTARVDVVWRHKQSADISVHDFHDLVNALLPLYVPVMYLEGFAIYRQEAHGLNLPRPKVLYTGTGLHNSPLFQTLAADWREEGTKLIGHQHGGNYGLDRVHSIEEHENRVLDRFYTLGWKGASPKQIPSVGAISSVQQLRPSRKANRVLLVCISFPTQVYRIQFLAMPSNINMSITETGEFICGMSSRQKLVVRPSFDYGWGMADLLKIYPDLRRDDTRSSIKSYKISDLIIHNYLGTSWLETLALNIPTVCFYSADIYAFRDAAQPYIDDLEAVGILHRSGADAARFVMSVINDPQGWWRRPEVQEARRSFVLNYANFSPDWATKWERQFKEVLYGE